MRTAFLAAAIFVALSTAVHAGPTPPPEPTPTLDWKAFNDRLKQSLQNHKLPEPLTPTQHEHVELIVETNRRGQIARVRTGKGSNDDAFNAMAYGNALQAFIRTEDGRAIPGTYKLIYDYSPETKTVRRTVALIKAGGVNPDAVGAVDDMAAVNRRRMELDQKLYEQALQKARAQKAAASPAPSPKP
jgi:hypothetical protein